VLVKIVFSSQRWMRCAVRINLLIFRLWWACWPYSMLLPIKNINMHECPAVYVKNSWPVRVVFFVCIFARVDWLDCSTVALNDRACFEWRQSVESSQLWVSTIELAELPAKFLVGTRQCDIAQCGTISGWREDGHDGYSSDSIRSCWMHVKTADNNCGRRWI